MYWIIFYLALLEGTTIIGGHFSSKSNEKQLPGFAQGEGAPIPRRRRDNSKCNEILLLYQKCSVTKFWDLNVVRNSTLYVEDCATLTSGASRIDCLNNFFCAATQQSCISVYSKWSSLSCSTGSKDNLLKKKVDFLTQLCSKQVHDTTCFSALYDTYEKVQKANDPGKVCNITEFKTDKCKNCHQRLSRLLRTTGCCFGSLMAIFPSTIAKTYELSPKAWKSCQLKPSVCSAKPTAGSSIVSTIGLPMTPDERQPSPTPSGSSSRLIAGGVLATIIFIVLVGIIGRFMYQRAMRRKNLRYEDYGYTQLRAMQDNLYDDEEDDDDQLLSAT